MVIRATDPAQLRAVIDAIHDEWFDVDEIRYDQELGRVQIPFKRGGGVEQWILQIAEVERLLVNESQGIGRYDFNKLSYSPDDGRLTIETGIPLEAYVDVRHLDVSVFQEEPPVGPLRLRG